jgi:hypothetical protein
MEKILDENLDKVNNYYDILTKNIENKEHRIFEAIMGSEKSKIITLLLITKLFIKSNAQIVFVCLLENLIN